MKTRSSQAVSFSAAVKCVYSVVASIMGNIINFLMIFCNSNVLLLTAYSIMLVVLFMAGLGLLQMPADVSLYDGIVLQIQQMHDIALQWLAPFGKIQQLVILLLVLSVVVVLLRPASVWTQFVFATFRRHRFNFALIRQDLAVQAAGMMASFDNFVFRTAKLILGIAMLTAVVYAIWQFCTTALLRHKPCRLIA